MFVLKEQIVAEQTIKKSRFRAVALPVDSESAVKAALAAHSDASANHNCYAWRIGSVYRFSDDGEPSGTAGKPIFQVMEGRQLDKALVIVSRWFGGVLLGAGGLVRAYGGTAAACLKEARLEETIPTAIGTTELGFQDLETVRAKLLSLGTAKIVTEAFNGTGCILTIEVAEKDATTAALLVSNLSRGRSMLSFSMDPADPNA